MSGLKPGRITRARATAMAMAVGTVDGEEGGEEAKARSRSLVVLRRLILKRATVSASSFCAGYAQKQASICVQGGATVNIGLLEVRGII